MARRRTTWVIVLGVLALAAVAALAFFLLRDRAVTQPAAGPSVTFDAPAAGAEMPVGRPVTVHAVARGAVKVVRVEVWVGEDMLAAQQSPLPDGASPFPITASWEPAEAGTKTLVARAFDAEGRRSDATLAVEVTPPSAADRDGDGVADDADTCPDAAGWASTGGCPDTDGGVAGVGPEGVEPPASEAVLPDDEAEPTTEGGGGPAGSEEGEDADGDGVPDASDSCPGAPGAAGMEGCPDVDGDGVPDYRDVCPDEAGTTEALGCPETGAGDADGDGVPDDVDLCPDEAGTPEDLGCPSAPEDAAEAEDVAEPFAEMHALQVVEFQALNMQVSDAYDGVSCYPSLAEAPVERYALEALGEQRWDVAAELGSRTLAVEPHEPITVRMECGADVVSMGAEGGWGTYWNLGEVSESHDPATWDGRTVTVTSVGGDEGRSFEVQYRLCAGSCESGQKAVILQRDGSWLTWEWDESIEGLSGYRVCVNGTAIATLRATSATASFDIADHEPPCGTTWEYTVTALWRDGSESMPSNVVTWTAESCPRVVRVTFDELAVGALGSDQGVTSSVGPIAGSFTATGSTAESLDFSAIDYGDWWGEEIRGYRLGANTTYAVQEIFDTIETWMLGSMSSPYHAPDQNWVTVELGPGEDLTVGAQILDADEGSNPTDTVFSAQRTLAADDVRPGAYRISDRNVDLTVRLDVVVGPEVADVPDLAVTGVDADLGQMRIHVFNSAAGMTEPADLTVEWTDLVTGEEIGTETWRDVQIPSGGERTLVVAEVSEVGGLRVVLDPEGAVTDGNPANNTYETPVVTRVEFLGASGAPCSEIEDAHYGSEWAFAFWAGHGTSESDVLWVGYNVRFPVDGEVKVCTDESIDCMPTAGGTTTWGDPRYTFDVEMPASENLYVSATGTEVDTVSDDDPFATDRHFYEPAGGWGAREAEYSEPLHATSSCDDAGCEACGDGDVTATWRITRVG